MQPIIIADRGYDEELKSNIAIENELKRRGIPSRISLDPADVDGGSGLIVPGAPPDVDPDLYGEDNTACREIDRELDDKRLVMIDRAIRLGRPLLGMCAGLQLINVYYGGTLVQDLGIGAPHLTFPGDLLLHPVCNIEGTVFHEMYGDAAIINTAHHQAVRKLAPCLKAGQVWLSQRLTGEERRVWLERARAGEIDEFPDECVLESFVHETLPIIGVQWHPELLAADPIPHAADGTKVFDLFLRSVDRV